MTDKFPEGTSLLPGALDASGGLVMNSINPITPLVVVCASLIVAMLFAGSLSF